MRWPGLVAALALSACEAEPREVPELCAGCAPGTVVLPVTGRGDGRSSFDALALDGFGQLIVGGEYQWDLRFGFSTLAYREQPAGFVGRVPFPGQPFDAIPVEPTLDLPTATSWVGALVVDPAGYAHAAYVRSGADVDGRTRVRLSSSGFGSVTTPRDLFTATGPVTLAGTTDRRGRPLFAVSGEALATGDASYPGEQALLARIDPDRPAVLAAWPGALVRELVRAADDTLLVAGDYTGAPFDGLPTCPDRCGLLARLDLDGGLRWARAYRGAGGAPTSLRAVAAGDDGTIVALATGDAPLLLLRFDPDGGLTGETPLATAPGALAGAQVALGADGTAYLAFTYAGTIVIDGEVTVTPAADTPSATMVAALRPDGRRAWSRLFVGSGRMLTRELIMVRGFPVLAGEVEGSLPLSDGDRGLEWGAAEGGYLMAFAP